MIQIAESAPKEVVRVLVGNKSDLNEEREVTVEEGKALAKKHKLPFIEVSAKQGKNVPELFDLIGKELIGSYLPTKKIEDPSYYEKAVLGYTEQSAQKEKRCEC